MRELDGKIRITTRAAMVCLLAVTLTTIGTKANRVFAEPVTTSWVVTSVIIPSIFGTFRYFFGKKRSNRPPNRGRNIVAMEVPKSAVGTASAQRLVMCMVDAINARARSKPDGFLGKAFYGKRVKKVTLKSGKVEGALGQKRDPSGSVRDIFSTAEITLDLESIKASSETDDYDLNVALTVFHELWHVGMPEDRTHVPGNSVLTETDIEYWATDFGIQQRRAWERVFGDKHPMYKVAVKGKPRKKKSLIVRGTICFADDMPPADPAPGTYWR